MELTCTICGKPFESCQSKAIYCSFPCKREGVRRRGREYLRMKKHPTIKCTQSVRKTCKYGLYGQQEWTCNYLEIEGHMRGCPYEDCDKYVKVREQRRRTPWRLKVRH